MKVRPEVDAIDGAAAVLCLEWFDMHQSLLALREDEKKEHKKF